MAVVEPFLVEAAFLGDLHMSLAESLLAEPNVFFEIIAALLRLDVPQMLAYARDAFAPVLFPQPPSFQRLFAKRRLLGGDRFTLASEKFARSLFERDAPSR